MPRKWVRLGPMEWSRGVLENLAEASRDRLGTFPGHLLPERRQLLDLFVEHRGLLFGVCPPQFDEIKR